MKQSETSDSHSYVLCFITDGHSSGRFSQVERNVHQYTEQLREGHAAKRYEIVVTAVHCTYRMPLHAHLHHQSNKIFVHIYTTHALILIFISAIAK